LTPTLVNQAVRKRLSDMRDIHVRGEATGVKVRNGHLYFDLKDSGSRLPVTVWRSQVQKLGLKLRDGDEVICRGQIDVWVPGGRYSFVAWHVALAGTGALWAAFQKLKEQLGKEGLFDRDRKRKLPFLPRTVGIVTSADGAALRDMVRIIGDRFPVRIVVAAAKVQGPYAPSQIQRAIQRLDRGGLCDVIICGRGGGSIEDLWAFNEEPVVRAIAACQTPIVSAVGHETDTLLSDYAADARAPTPTAAAEMVVPSRAELSASIAATRLRLRRRLQTRVAQERRALRSARSRLGHGQTLVLQPRRAIDELTLRAQHAMREHLGDARVRLGKQDKRLQRAHPHARLARQQAALTRLRQRLLAAGPAAVARARKRQAIAQTRLLGVGRSGQLAATCRRKLATAHATLRALDPRAALGRGYSIVRDRQTGKAIRAAHEVAVGAELDVLLAAGQLEAVVTGRATVDEGKPTSGESPVSSTS